VSDEGKIVIGLDAPKVTESVPVPMNPHPEIVSVAPPAVKSAAGEIPLTANGPQLAAATVIVATCSPAATSAAAANALHVRTLIRPP